MSNEPVKIEKRGGRREGAGRKVGESTLISQRARAYAMKRLEEELEPIMSASINLAKGIYVEEIDEDTGERIKVYKKTPDVNALKHALDQLIGKPTENLNMNHSGEISLSQLLGMSGIDTDTD